MNDDDFEEMMIQNDTTVNVPQQDRTRVNKNPNNVSDNRQRPGDSFSVNSRGDYSREVMRSSSPVAGCSKTNEGSPVIPVLGSKVKVRLVAFILSWLI